MADLAVAPGALIQDYRHGFHDPEDAYAFKSDKGLTREIVERISAMKGEPEWMRTFRLKAYELFRAKPMPDWGDSALLSEIDFNDIHYFVRALHCSRCQLFDWRHGPQYGYPRQAGGVHCDSVCDRAAGDSLRRRNAGERSAGLSASIKRNASRYCDPPT